MDGLLIGRFQPFHLGHLEALRFALSRVEKLWVGLGSSNKPVEKNNPFTAQQRKEMILSSVDGSMREKISIYLIPDVDNHIRWIEKIDATVPKFDMIFSNDDLTKHLYSKRNIKVLGIPFLNRDSLSGTNIRDLIVNDQRWEDFVPDGTRNFLKKINAKELLKNL